MPCSTPGRPPDSEAAWPSGTSRPWPAASTPKISTLSSSRKGWNRPIAFEPPPMQATRLSGRRPSASCICALRLVADHALEIAHHRGIGMRARRRADAIERVGDIGDPVAQRLVHRVLQRARARLHRHDFGAQHLHAENVRLLPLDVDRAHVDDAGQAEARAGGRGGDAVLAGARLGDDARSCPCGARAGSGRARC